MVAGMTCAMVLTGAGQQPVKPWLAASAVPIALGVLYLSLIPGPTIFPEHRREFRREIPPPGIFALPKIWARYRLAQTVLLGVVIPIALVYLSTTVLDPILRSALNVSTEVTGENRNDWYVGVPVAWMTVTIVANVVAEEILFRGIGLALWQFRDQTDDRRRRAVLLVGVALWYGVVSVALFGYSHVEWGAWNVLLTATFGLLIFPIVLKTRSLWPAIVAHAAGNLDSFGVLNWIR
jgi:membrane protease YdiL (CAAX protease family)